MIVRQEISRRRKERCTKRGMEIHEAEEEMEDRKMKKRKIDEEGHLKQHPEARNCREGKGRKKTRKYKEEEGGSQGGRLQSTWKRAERDGVRTTDRLAKEEEGDPY